MHLFHEILKQDGFHYSRDQLRAIASNSTTAASSTPPTTFEDLIARRGSPWTFDAASLVQSLRTAKAQCKAELPTYSRQKSDPVPGGVELKPCHRVVLCEGNYLLNFEDPKWSGLQELFEEKWFISCADPEQQRRRLIARHLETWTPEKERMFGPGEIGAAKKADSNDVINSVFVEGHKKFADRVIVSL